MISERIKSDLKTALKAGDSFFVSTLRMAQSALHNRALEKRAKLAREGGPVEDAVLTDDEVVAVLRSEAKKRKDAAAEFKKGNRRELAEKELKEAGLIEAYLPKEPDDAEIESAVAAAVDEVGSDPEQFGKIMGLAMKKLEGRASGDRVSAVVKKVLGV